MISYHATEDNSLYNFAESTKTDVSLKTKKNSINTQDFLDDICTWMDNNRNIIKNKYLPFSYLSIGLIPSQASAFLFGCFVGRALEKNKITVHTEVTEIDKNMVEKKVKDDIKHQMNWLSGLLEEMDNGNKEEKKDDKIWFKNNHKYNKENT